MATRVVRNSTDLASDGAVSAGDNLVFADGSRAITSNLNQSGLGAGGIANLTVERNFTGGGGSEGSPLRCEVGTLFDFRAGGGKWYYRPNGNSDTCALLRMAAAGAAALSLVTGGTVTLAELESGVLSVGTAVALAGARVIGSAVVDLFDDASTRPTSWTAAGGLSNLYRGINGTMNISAAARVVHKAQNSSSNNTTTVNLYGGSYDLVAGGTLTNLNWYSGALNISRLEGYLTVTNSEIWRRSQAVDALLNHPRVTFTNSPVLRF